MGNIEQRGLDLFDKNSNFSHVCAHETKNI